MKKRRYSKINNGVIFRKLVTHKLTNSEMPLKTIYRLIGVTGFRAWWKTPSSFWLRGYLQQSPLRKMTKMMMSNLHRRRNQQRHQFSKEVSFKVSQKKSCLADIKILREARSEICRPMKIRYTIQLTAEATRHDDNLKTKLSHGVDGIFVWSWYLPPATKLKVYTASRKYTRINMLAKFTLTAFWILRLFFT